jgi:hypothetical protein
MSDETAPDSPAPTQPEDPRKVRLHKREREIKPPGSYALRTEILGAFQANQVRGLAAALGACCPRLEKDLAENKRPIAPYVKDCNALRYGGDIIDGLMALGVPLEDIGAAGAKALTLIVDSFVDEEQVRAARGN